MKKITVKHYLNTNVKPHLVRSEKYYPIQILITANSKVTRAKSHAFGEIHTEEEFNSFLKSGTADHEKMKAEEGTIQNLIEAQMEIDMEQFDINLFSAFYNHTRLYNLSESDLFTSARAHLSNFFGDNDFFGDRMIDRNTPSMGLTFYEWFNPSEQKLNAEYLKNKGIANHRAIKIFNEIVLLCFFKFLKDIARLKSKKYGELKKRYTVYFDNPEQAILSSLKSLK